MYHTFNCGIGMVACVAASSMDNTLMMLRNLGEQPWYIGHVEQMKEPGARVIIKNP